MIKVSVIVTTYNRPEFLKETINSILNQTFVDFELIVVDNNSNYDFFKLIDSLNDSRIKAFQNENNGIISVNRNFGIKLSKGKYIAFCDDDDLWERDKLERQIKMTSKGYNFIFTNTKYFKSSKGLFNKVYSKYVISLIINKLNNKISYFLLSVTNPIVNSSVLVKKNLISKIKFNESILYTATEDYQLWIQIYDSAKPYYIKKELVKYRIHENNFSSDLYTSLKRSLLVMNDFNSQNFCQRLFKKFGIFFYSFRIFINKILS